MDLYRASRGRRITAIIDFRLTQEDMIRAFLWAASTMSSDQLKHTPTTAACCRQLQAALWLRGIDGLHTDTAATPAATDWASRCTQRIWNSRQVKPEPTDSAR